MRQRYSQTAKCFPRKWLKWAGDETSVGGARASVDGHDVCVKWVVDSRTWVVSHVFADEMSEKAFRDRMLAFRWAAERCGCPVSIGNIRVS